MSADELLLGINTGKFTGLPFATSSFVTGSSIPLAVGFPFVAKKVTIRNADSANALLVGFTNNAVATSNFFTLMPVGSGSLSIVTFDDMLQTIYLSTSGSQTSCRFEIHASMTGTPTGSIPVLSQSLTGAPTIGFQGLPNMPNQPSVPTSYKGI